MHPFKRLLAGRNWLLLLLLLWLLLLSLMLLLTTSATMSCRSERFGRARLDPQSCC